MTSLRRFDARTMPALLRLSAERVAARNFLRALEPTRLDVPRLLSFADFELAVRRAVRTLRDEAGVGPGDRVLLLAENSVEWQVYALAAQALRAEPAALFASLDSTTACDIARRVRPRCVVVSGAAQWAKLAPVAEELVVLRAVIGIPPELAPTGVRALPFQSAEEPLGAGEYRALVESVGETDPFLLLFTSGTSGRQKGVRLTQGAFVRSLEGGWDATAMSELDDGLCFLPFAHIAGQCQFMLAVALGHSLIMVARREDISRGLELGPTYVFSVPLVYERIRDTVLQKVAAMPAPVSALLKRALRGAIAGVVEKQPSMLDRALAPAARLALGRRLQASMGGRLRVLISGGAPASPELFGFFEAMGIPFLEIYGMSETAGLIAANRCDTPRRPGVAGVPAKDLQLRIEEDGELLVRGPLLMSGYLDEPSDSECFTEDGFFRTGDLARLEPDGAIAITGRKKSLLVLSTGKKLSPEPVEQALVGTPVDAAVLVGDGRPYAVAVLFVPVAELRSFGDAAPQRLLELLQTRCEACADYERPKRVLVLAGTAADYPELVTPTLKLKRNVVQARFAAALDRLYDAPKGHSGFVVE